MSAYDVEALHALFDDAEKAMFFVEEMLFFNDDVVFNKDEIVIEGNRASYPVLIGDDFQGPVARLMLRVEGNRWSIDVFSPDAYEFSKNEGEEVDKADFFPANVLIDSIEGIEDKDIRPLIESFDASNPGVDGFVYLIHSSSMLSELEDNPRGAYIGMRFGQIVNDLYDKEQKYYDSQI